jgi:hypothetical protein
VLFDIRLHTQKGENDMAESLRQLININDQMTLFADLRVYNPLFRYQNWAAQRFYNLLPSTVNIEQEA